MLAETLFEPSIDDRVSCNFRVLPLSDNWSLCRRLPVWEINSQLPQALVDPYSDRVANTPILHKLSLDLNCWLLQRGHSFCAISRLSGQLPRGNVAWYGAIWYGAGAMSLKRNKNSGSSIASDNVILISLKQSMGSGMKLPEKSTC